MGVKRVGKNKAVASCLASTCQTLLRHVAVTSPSPIPPIQAVAVHLPNLSAGASRFRSSSTSRLRLTQKNQLPASSGAMASSSRALAAVGLTSQLAHPACIASRTYSTAVRNHPLRSALCSALRPAQRPSVSMKLAASRRIAFRRAYANEAPKPTSGKLRKTLRWAWRLTYLSAAGLVGYTCLIVYQDRHPEPQFEPDPSKKTLVILGERHRTLFSSCAWERKR